MNEDIERIYGAFDGKLVGTFAMKVHVCGAVSNLPTDIQKQITQTCWFLSSMKDAWAFTFTGNDLKDQHLIFLSDDLLSQDAEQIQWTILHEIGHVILGHRNSTLVKQSKKEVDQQEIEADAFARQYTQNF